MSSNKNQKKEEGQSRILYPPDSQGKKDQAKEILRYVDHIIWLENHIQTKFGEFACLIEGQPLPPLVHPVWVTAEPRPQRNRTGLRSQTNAQASDDASVDENAQSDTATASQVPANGITIEIYNNQYQEIDKQIAKRKELLPQVVGSVIATFSSSFLTHIKNTASAKTAKRNNDVINILKEAEAWFMSYLNPTSDEEINLQEKKDYEDKFKKLHQTQDQSVDEWKNTFNSHVDILKTFGINLTEKEKAFEFIIKLNHTLYKSKVDILREEEEDFKVKKKHHTTLEKEKGFPVTMAEAYDTARLWEHQNVLRPKQQKKKRKQPEAEESKEEEDAPENKSYARIKKGKGNGKRIYFKTHEEREKWEKERSYPGSAGKIKAKERPKHPFGTKPSEIGLKACSYNHAPGDDTDHLSYHCPLKKRAYAMVQEQIKKPTASSITPSVSSGATTTSTLSDWSQPRTENQQQEYAFMSRLCDMMMPRMMEISQQQQNEKRYTHMMVFAYKQTKTNPYTLLLDTGGSDNDFAHPAFIFNKRENPNKNIPITTVMGNYFCQEICTVPFLGRSGVSKPGSLNIISFGKLKKTPNISIEANPEIDFVKVKFILLNVTINFDFNHSSDVLLADGERLAERISEYKSKADLYNLDIFELIHENVNIDKIGEYAYGNKGPKKLNAISYLNQTQADSNIKSYAKVNLNEDKPVTKRSIELATQVRRLQHASGSFGPDKFAESVSNGSIVLEKMVPISIIRKADEILGFDPDAIAGIMTHPRNYPTIAEYRVDITKNEVLMMTDIIDDGNTLLLTSIISPSAYVLGEIIENKSAQELMKALTAQILWFRTVAGKKVKKIVSDSETGLKAIQDDLLTWSTNAGENIENSASLENLPRGVKPALIDRCIRTLKDHVRSMKSRIQSQQYNFPIDGLLTTALYINCICFMNLLSHKHNPNNASAHKVIFGEPAMIQKIAKHKPLDVVGVPVEGLQSNLTANRKSVYALALYPIKPWSNIFKWAYLNLESAMVIERSHAVQLPFNKKISDAIVNLVNDKNSKLFKFSKKGKKIVLPILPVEEKEVLKADIPTTPDQGSASLSFPIKGVETMEPSQIFQTPEKTPTVTNLINDPEPEAISPMFSPVNKIREDLFSEPITSLRISKCGFIKDKNYDFNDFPIISFLLLKNIDEKDALPSQCSAERAIKTSYHDDVYRAVADEIKGMVDRKVWKGVDIKNLSKEERKAIIRSSCFVKRKLNAIENIFKFKARIVTDGSMQDRTLYKESDISSPTVKLATIFTLAVIAAAYGYDISTADVAQAYLNSPMPFKVHVKLTKLVSEILSKEHVEFKKYLDEKNQITVQLQKGQYGCIESAKLWYNTISKFLKSKGFSANPYDECLFQKINSDGSRIYTAIYVDDLFTIASDPKLINELNKDLENEYGKMSINLTKIHKYLGMKFDFSENSKVKVTMQDYLAEIVSESDIKTVAETPAGDNLFNISPKSPLLEEKQRESFHSTVAQLLFAAIRVRPDILLPVIFLTSRVTKATEEDAKKLRRILRYLKGTSELGIILGPDADGELRIHMFADASYGVHEDCKSHSGIDLTLGRGPIRCRSIKQKIVARSSTEAEIIAASDASKEAAHQANLLEAMQFELQPVIFHQDNQSAIKMMENGGSYSDRTKHMKIRYFFIKQYLDSGEFLIEYTPTDIMIADILTKPLQGKKFIQLRDKLLGYSLH